MPRSTRATAGVICAGNIVHDILVRPVDQVRWGTSAWVESIEPHLGGNGANAAYALARLAVPVRLLGLVGSDDFGNRCLETLAAASVDTSRIGRSALPTATTVALVHPSGERALLHRPGASRDAFRDPIDFSTAHAEGFRRFHLGNLFALEQLRTTAAETLRDARKANLETSIDTGWDALGEWMNVLEPCLDHCDLLFVNREEARMLTGMEDPAEAAARLQSGGARRVVVKLGSDGCALWSEGEEQRVAAFDVPVVDSTGAGDCFAGGFLAGLSHGMSLTEAARLANAAGALSISRLGAVEGLVDFDATLDWIRKRSSGD